MSALLESDVAGPRGRRSRHKDYWQAMRAYPPRGAYVNFMADEGEDHVRETYRGNYERLVQIKRKYDPGNLQNIKP